MITLHISNGPMFQVPWVNGMNVQHVLEKAFDNVSVGIFMYALQYYGSDYGYMVDMMNGTYDTFGSGSQPYFFWEFFINGQMAHKGIDGIRLKDGDVINFQFNLYSAATPEGSLSHVKFNLKKMVLN